MDVESIEAREHRRHTQPSHDCPDREAVHSDIQALIDELTRARASVRQLTENDADLRASAEIWCQLYDASVARANAAEAAAARLRRDPSEPPLPDNVKSLYAALDRVVELTDVLGTVVRECEVCARRACDAAGISAQTSEACVRCIQALEALDALKPTPEVLEALRAKLSGGPRPPNARTSDARRA